MPFRIRAGAEREAEPAPGDEPRQGAAADAEREGGQPRWPVVTPRGGWGGASSPILADIERRFIHVFALVAEAIAGATHALLASDRQAAKQLVERDEQVDREIDEIVALAQGALVHGAPNEQEREQLVAVLRMAPDLERNGDLAEHIARRAARGLGAEMTARSRGLVERMGEVATEIWAATNDALGPDPSATSHVEDLDDELDDLHVTLTAELVAGTMPLPVAIELAMVARFYERFGDHAVNLTRRMTTPPAGGNGPGER